MKQMVAAGLVGAVIGAAVHAYWSAWDVEAPSSANGCIMERLGDMKTDSATDVLVRLCRWEFGDLQRGDH